MLMQPYTEDYYKVQQGGSLQSAKIVAPLAQEFVNAKTVIDVGCGVGTWLSVFKDGGAEVYGVDGDYINRSMLLIPEDRFMPADLKQPLHLEQMFDLAVSVEVAEHLPTECSEQFVDSLVRLAPIVLFSAATPFQGGTKHINEQWQDYWANLFRNKNYVAVDCIRKRVWQNTNVIWYYAQNILLYVREDYLKNYPELQKEYELTHHSQLSILHPRAITNMSMKSMLSLFPVIMKNMLQKRLKKLKLK